MARVVGIGNQSFESIIKEECFYIDKTAFIKEWWENKDIVTLITRPRRFGKTLNMDMIKCFFSNEYKDRGDLFEGLDIWKEEKYRKLQGTYPVIFLSFAAIKQNNYQDTIAKIKKIICSLYQSFMFLKDWDGLTDEEKNYDAELIGRGVNPSNIHHYGFAFKGKEVLIDGTRKDAS